MYIKSSYHFSSVLVRHRRKSSAQECETNMPGIGSLNEKPLHASLKEWYARPGDRTEVDVDGYVVDIVRDDVLLEIQTRSFASMKAKLSALLPAHRIRLVHPIAIEKWIVKMPKGRGTGGTRRKSPKRGRSEDMFWEFVSFPRLLEDPNFSFEVLMIKEEEVRRQGRGRNWRRGGWGTEERRLLEVVDRKVFEEPADWLELLPPTLGVEFTTEDLAEEAGMTRTLAQKMAYCLRMAGVIEQGGKRGRSNLYRVVDDRLERTRM